MVVQVYGRMDRYSDVLYKQNMLEVAKDLRLGCPTGSNPKYTNTSAMGWFRSKLVNLFGQNQSQHLNLIGNLWQDLKFTNALLLN